MNRDCLLVRDEHIPEKSAHPVIDAHNHLWGNWSVERLVKVLDAVGVACFCDVTGNARVAFADGGYHVEERSLDEFFAACTVPHPGRFYCFTMATFARPTTKPLFEDPHRFVDETLAVLNEHVQMGARGLKILKALGLAHRDASGRLVNVDDPELAPIWEEAGKLGIPVLMHQSDPSGFFAPSTPANEHYESLQKCPSWSFSDSKFPRKEALLRRRDDLVRQHPGTTFILPHVANFAENLSYVSTLLDENPNVYIDFSARLDELGRQPYTARKFFIRYQERIVFGTDMPADIDESVDMYRCYFRFLETFDEYFFSPDYDGTFERHRWPICGIGLPKEVLHKIYQDNVLQIVPGLKDDLRQTLGAD